MQEKNKRLLDNFISVILLKMMLYIIPFVTLPYQTRVLGVENFGLVSFAMAFVGYCTNIVDYGFDASATYKIAKHRSNMKAVSNIFSSVLVTKTLLMLVSFVVVILLIMAVPKFREQGLLFMATMPVIIGSVIYPMWFFMGMERMKYVTFMNIVSRSIFMVLLFVFVKKPDDYYFVPLLTSIGSIVAGCLSLHIALRRFKIKLYIPKWKSIVRQFKYSTQFFVAKLSYLAMSNTNVFCLGLIGSSVMVGYYSAAEKLYLAIFSILHSVLLIMFPYMTKNKDINIFKKVMSLALLVTILICTFMFVFAKQIVTIFYGAEMLEAYKVLQIFSITIVFNFICGAIGDSLLGAFGFINKSNKTVVVSSVIHIIGLLVLYMFNALNIYNIAYLLLAGSIIAIFMRLYYLHKYKIWQNNN
ncbi:MAG: flippase [Candidatus Gastranaerophilales bacterium]|nr:flippase [Candidatus Gastranaerophilales bacterium]